jgi:phosphatidylinositol glycan class N
MPLVALGGAAMAALAVVLGRGARDGLLGSSNGSSSSSSSSSSSNGSGSSISDDAARRRRGPGVPLPRWRVVLHVAMVLVATASALGTDYALLHRQGSPWLCRWSAWAVSALAVAIPAWDLVLARQPRGRVYSATMGAGTIYLLLSVTYESVFFVALVATLHCWLAATRADDGPAFVNVVTEAKSMASTAATARKSSTAPFLPRAAAVAFYLLLFVNTAFFGTGNVASFSSFEISAVYRFTTVFDPFLMGALLVARVLVPFVPVGCAVQLRASSLRRSNGGGSGSGGGGGSIGNGGDGPRSDGTPFRVLYLNTALWEVLAVHALFMVRNTGSWLDIGVSISVFVICNAQVAFNALLFVATEPITRGLGARVEGGKGE